jgi:predicted nucleic acid-binding protein
VIVFADTNWLEAIYITPHPGDKKGQLRAEIVERRMRRHEGGLTISQIVLMETRNIFSRIRKTPHPVEWDQLLTDFDGEIFVDTMNWDALRLQVTRLIEKFAHKADLGTFDLSVVASAQLAGAKEILSFDERLKALASATGISVFPPLNEAGHAFLIKLKTR